MERVYLGMMMINIFIKMKFMTFFSNEVKLLGLPFSNISGTVGPEYGCGKGTLACGRGLRKKL